MCSPGIVLLSSAIEETVKEMTVQIVKAYNGSFMDRSRFVYMLRLASQTCTFQRGNCSYIKNIPLKGTIYTMKSMPLKGTKYAKIYTLEI